MLTVNNLTNSNSDLIQYVRWLYPWVVSHLRSDKIKYNQSTVLAFISASLTSLERPAWGIVPNVNVMYSPTKETPGIFWKSKWICLIPCWKQWQNIVHEKKYILQVVIYPHVVSGQGFIARASLTTEIQRQCGSPWLGVPGLPAPSQGTGRAGDQLGALCFSLGLETGQDHSE